MLSATTELAREGGWDAVQMREVAQRSDVALGTLYYVFVHRHMRAPPD